MAGITESDLLDDLRRENEKLIRLPGELTMRDIAVALDMTWNRAKKLVQNKVDRGEFTERKVYDPITRRNLFVYAQAAKRKK